MLSLRLDQGSELNQGKTRLGQGTARPGHGQWLAVGTAALGQAVDGHARQADPGHGTGRQCWAQARAR